MKGGVTGRVVRGVASMPPGSVPTCPGLILLAALLVEPWIFRRKVVPRLWARLRGRPLPPPEVEMEAVAVAAVPTHGSAMAAREIHARGLKRFLDQREGAAVLFMPVVLALGMYHIGSASRRARSGP